MALEVHLTLDVPRDAEPGLVAWAKSRSLDVTCIQLSRGEHARQVMLSLHTSDPLQDTLAYARAIARAANDACHTRYVRTKVETLASDTSERGRGLYLEHHVRVRIERDELPRLQRLATELDDAHLSRNAFRAFEGTTQERFITQRFASGCGEQAQLAFDQTIATLARAEFVVTKVERERVLFDDCLALDAGWMEGVRC
jgi:hypothetical protein